MRKLLLLSLVYWSLSFLFVIFSDAVVGIFGSDYREFMDFFVFWIAFGAVIFLMLWFAVNGKTAKLEKRIDDLQRSNDQIKATLYDMEHPEEPKPEATFQSEAESKSQLK
jgi:hypothetical protein